MRKSELFKLEGKILKIQFHPVLKGAGLDSTRGKIRYYGDSLWTVEGIPHRKFCDLDFASAKPAIPFNGPAEVQEYD